MPLLVPVISTFKGLFIILSIIYKGHCKRLGKYVWYDSWWIDIDHYDTGIHIFSDLLRVYDRICLEIGHFLTYHKVNFVERLGLFLCIFNRINIIGLLYVNCHRAWHKKRVIVYNIAIFFGFYEVLYFLHFLYWVIRLKTVLLINVRIESLWGFTLFSGQFLLNRQRFLFGLQIMQCLLQGFYVWQ